MEINETKRLGFGCMRLPMLGGAEGTVDLAQFSQMIDRYLAAGFGYFDTARVYLGGQSETALRECLVKRYPRDAFILTDKLSGSQFQCEADILPLFQSQLDAMGVTFFDYYLMHSQSAAVYEKFMNCNAYEVVRQLKAAGKIRHMGISFHDKAEVLEKILKEHPEIEVVQIQFNYLDVSSPSIDSMGVYEVCRRYQKPVFVMEPVKGGVLAQLPEQAQQLLQTLGTDQCPANYAIRYAASFEGVSMVLSGMSDLAQMDSNLAVMQSFQPLTEQEHQVLSRITEILKAQDMIQCTGCRYCTAGCPRRIRIPDLFSCANTKKRYGDWSSDYYYQLHTFEAGKPEDCIRCRKCERICPQHLQITELLQQVARLFRQEQA